MLCGPGRRYIVGKMKRTLIVSHQFEEAVFLKRTNSHTIRIRLHARESCCYLPAAGNEETLLIPGSRVFVSASKKLPEGLLHRAISTVYQKSYVLLDRQQPARILYELAKAGLLFGPSSDTAAVKKNARIGPGRFDLLIERRTRHPLIVTAELCSLCHNGIALIPEAGGEVPACVQYCAPAGHEQCTMFLVTSSSARTFIPNIHTNPGFCRSLFEAEKVAFGAVGCTLVDPVTVDLDSAHNLECDLETARENDTNMGSYLLVLENRRSREIPVGKLGCLLFKAGYYVYVGSGMNGVDKRVARHRSGNKRHHWHIDHITPAPMRITRVYTIRRKARLEGEIAARMERIAPRPIQGFGSSDSKKSSHLFYFPGPPNHRRDFLDLVMDFMTFSAP